MRRHSAWGWLLERCRIGRFVADRLDAHTGHEARTAKAGERRRAVGGTVARHWLSATCVDRELLDERLTTSDPLGFHVPSARGAKHFDRRVSVTQDEIDALAGRLGEQQAPLELGQEPEAKKPDRKALSFGPVDSPAFVDVRGRNVEAKAIPGEPRVERRCTSRSEELEPECAPRQNGESATRREAPTRHRLEHVDGDDEHVWVLRKLRSRGCERGATTIPLALRHTG